ncbi:LysM peptidoglycan-binding domain-containing protein [Pseudolysinimonas sp.]|uniref:LysM peptidoglycan-binding domain-containing protein n=1 Tax=Pseudolysinimonas sp. TaxID=2680009 RepID=UPI00286D1132|nr:LysM peptidoglycan-binding domain-containing protein [Pseudolysinimonas sp.]
MTDVRDAEDTPRPLFPGLVSTKSTSSGGGRHRGERRRGPLGEGFRKTLPFVVASAMTMGLNLTGSVEPVAAAPKKPAKPKADLSTSMRSLIGAATRVAAGGGSAAAASTYIVQAGDTVAAIAGRHGLSTASVLALNGLGWKSLIFPGQVLKLAAGATFAPASAQEGGRYSIARGDTISRIAARFGVPVESVLNANGLGWSSIIYPGQTIAIPAVAAPAAPQIELVSATSPAAPTAPTAPPAPPAPTSSYTIQSGDTISSIASRLGVTTQAVLDANGLTPSSIIYPGRNLVIPAAGGSSAGGSSGGSVTTLTAEQEANARIIIQVGREQGVPDYGIIIALATAMQESSLRNINYGDRDSVGLFQQRTSSGWGTIDEIMNPHHSAYLFYQGRSGYTRGLLDISGWQSMALTVAAQKVQVSAYPNHYAKWEASARAWFAALA